MKTRAKAAAIPRRDRNFRVKIRQRQLPYKVYTTGTTLLYSTPSLQGTDAQ